MTKRICSTLFQELLAHSIASDPSIKAAADALDAVLRKTTQGITDVLLYDRLAYDSKFVDPVDMLPPMERLRRCRGDLAELPEDVLDLLGWQLHVDNYDTAVDIQAKRELIANSLILHRRKGTPWAVMFALDTALRLSAPTELSEWFQYGGKPYFFRVTLDVSDTGMSGEEITNAIKLILEHKAVRSWLEYLRTKTIRKLPVYMGTWSAGRTLNKVRLFFPPKPVPQARRWIACASVVQTASTLRLYTPGKPGTLSMHTAFALKTMTRSTVWPRFN